VVALNALQKGENQRTTPCGPCAPHRALNSNSNSTHRIRARLLFRSGNCSACRGSRTGTGGGAKPGVWGGSVTWRSSAYHKLVHLRQGDDEVVVKVQAAPHGRQLLARAQDGLQARA
jgi:hypothetical protein